MHENTEIYSEDLFHENCYGIRCFNGVSSIIDFVLHKPMISIGNDVSGFVVSAAYSILLPIQCHFTVRCPHLTKALFGLADKEMEHASSDFIG
ncbi:hypothetical protein V6N13_131364 [Hibiscus sabdariffa]|uniref:Uncharacterized protein n=1 Tax=Hibiscus sabdariffa TaxID=183260 RepID=A0ABR2D9B7_9ROSI